MFSISQDIENAEFTGWLSPQILLKNNRRQSTGSRKRGYDLANIDLNEQCDDIRRRVLRPRHDRDQTGDNHNSSDASRTRPIRSNRTRPRPTNQTSSNALGTNSEASNEVIQCPLMPVSSTTSSDMTLPAQTQNELSLLHALAAYNWSQNYLLPHSDPLFLHRVHQAAAASYPSQLSGTHSINQRIPQFDPWVLHNYLLAASYGATGVSSHSVSPDGSSDDAGVAASMRMAGMNYAGLTADLTRHNSILWPYPLFVNQSSSANGAATQSNSTRPSHELHNSSTSHHLDPSAELSYYLRLIDYSQRDSVPLAATDSRLYQAMFASDPRMTSFCHPMLSSSCAYGSICPYHSVGGHLLHSNSPASHMSTGTQQPDPVSSQSTQNNSYGHTSTGLAFTDQFWPQLGPSIRPLNYTINGSNIDALLHLAANFEQRKRGITKEELDKLPTHRYKSATIDKHKHKLPESKTSRPSSENSDKCLVCLDDFEPKQNIRSLRCEHEFHAKCIDKWLKINRTCPLCRADAFDGSAQKDGA